MQLDLIALGHNNCMSLCIYSCNIIYVARHLTSVIQLSLANQHYVSYTSPLGRAFKPKRTPQTPTTDLLHSLSNELASIISWTQVRAPAISHRDSEIMFFEPFWE